MSLVDGLVDLAVRRYQVDWSEVRASVLQRLQPTALFQDEVLEVRNFPTYWCVPLLVGDYLDSSRQAVMADLEPFVSACLVRHFLFDARRVFDLAHDDETFQMVAAAYDGCRLDTADTAFDARFAAKCQPWTVLLALGTRSILAEAASRSDFDAVNRAIVLVYSCLQIIDDWHDRADDVARGHWNMWVDEPATRTLAIVEPLAVGAGAAIAELRPHLLRRALTAQMDDTVRELTEVVDLQRNERPRHFHRSRPSARFDGLRSFDRLNFGIQAGVDFLRRRLDSERLPLWRDFELKGVSAGSTECVSAFVADQLATVPEARQLSRVVAAHLLTLARADGGWGYRQDVPADCDSTAWVLLAAAATSLAIPPEVLSISRRFIISHQRRNGGFATYQRAARQSLTRANQEGWFQPELSVTSSAVLALKVTGSAQQDRLRDASRFIAARSDRGMWTSYWWPGSGYATFMAARALHSERNGAHDALLTSTSQFMLGHRRSDGGWSENGDSPEGFATALALQTLMLCPPSVSIDVVNTVAQLLLDLQRSTGAWPATATMLAPGAAEKDDLVLRDNEIVTTACVLSTMSAARALLVSRVAQG